MSKAWKRLPDGSFVDITDLYAVTPAPHNVDTVVRQPVPRTALYFSIAGALVVDGAVDKVAEALGLGEE